jgi:collagenase-like PrtC family protease
MITELLSPAGSLKNMRYAFAYGADAVYAGQPRYSLRVRNNEFDHENLKIGIDEAHALGKNSMLLLIFSHITANLKILFVTSSQLLRCNLMH